MENVEEVLSDLVATRHSAEQARIEDHVLNELNDLPPELHAVIAENFSVRQALQGAALASKRLRTAVNQAFVIMFKRDILAPLKSRPISESERQVGKFLFNELDDNIMRILNAPEPFPLTDPDSAHAQKLALATDYQHVARALAGSIRNAVIVGALSSQVKLCFADLSAPDVWCIVAFRRLSDRPGETTLSATFRPHEPPVAFHTGALSLVRGLQEGLAVRPAIGTDYTRGEMTKIHALIDSAVLGFVLGTSPRLWCATLNADESVRSYVSLETHCIHYSV